MNDEDDYRCGDPSCWYGYDVYRRTNEGPQQCEVRIFTKDFPRTEAGGHSWTRTTYYSAWFATMQEAEDAARAFCHEMHWRREAEEVGVGEKLYEQAAVEVSRAGAELAELWQTNKEQMNKRFQQYHRLQLQREIVKNVLMYLHKQQEHRPDR